MGAEIAARVMEQAFDHLEAPVARVTGWDVPYPPASLEQHYLPSVERIAEAVRRTVSVLMAERVFAMPDLGEGLEEGEIVAWLVAEGDDGRAEPAARRGGDGEGDRRDPVAVRRDGRVVARRRWGTPCRSARRW